MNSLTDFDYQPHRTATAAVAPQKGVYHLFILRNYKQTDLYEQVIRLYQCVFQLSLALLLLDEAKSLLRSKSNKQAQLPPSLRPLCANGENPRRDKIDPASVVTHSDLRNWHGFPIVHPLAPIGTKARDLYSRVEGARHNLLYRPFLLDVTTNPSIYLSPFWEDSQLRDLIGEAPTWQDIEATYENFASAIWMWRSVDVHSSIPSDFIRNLFEPYIDKSGERPTETVLLRYARMLSGDDQAILTGLRQYRNKLIGQNEHLEESLIRLDPEYNVGEI